MKNLMKYLFLTSVAFLASINTFAQVPNPCYDPEVYCPIDGGLALLIGTGILIGVRQAKQLRA